MPRLPRLNLQGVLYYVTSRGGDQTRTLFRDQEDYFAYLRLFFEYKARYGVEAFAYCLLPDQVHLCLELGAHSNISGLMHDVTTRYTKYFNRRYNRSGHLFQDRFRTVLMEKDAYLLDVTAYIHSLPARIGLSREFVTYPYSSCEAYLDMESRDNAKEMASGITEVLSLLPAGYDAFLNQIEPETMDRLEHNLEQRILGSEAFVAQIRSRIKAAQGLPTSEPAALPSKQPQVSERPTRKFSLRPARAAWATGAAVVLLSLTVAVQNRLGSLEETLGTLAKENESLFKTRGVFAGFESSSSAPAQLTATEWDIRLMPTAAGSASPVAQDRLTFTADKQVSSEALVGLGFSSVSMRTGPPHLDGTVTWEAMQTNTKGEAVSWRGEWRSNTMRGVMTRHLRGKSPENFSFVGILQRPFDAQGPGV